MFTVKRNVDGIHVFNKVIAIMPTMNIMKLRSNKKKKQEANSP